MRKTAQQLIREARNECQRVAEGAFTPIALERYEFIGGERGWSLGYPSETAEGSSCIVWTHKPSQHNFSINRRN